jgi:hypothetical protein
MEGHIQGKVEAGTKDGFSMQSTVSWISNGSPFIPTFPFIPSCLFESLAPKGWWSGSSGKISA